MPRLGFFESFEPEELEALEGQVDCLELPRSAVVFERGQHPDACVIVVRGALEQYLVCDDRWIPLTVLGPGRLLGTAEVIDGEAHVGPSVVRESAVIFEMSADILRNILSRHSWPALKTHLALCAHLIADLGHLNRRVARIAAEVSAGR